MRAWVRERVWQSVILDTPNVATATKAVWGILACVYIAGCVLIFSTVLQRNTKIINIYIHINIRKKEPETLEKYQGLREGRRCGG